MNDGAGGNDSGDGGDGGDGASMIRFFVKFAACIIFVKFAACLCEKVCFYVFIYGCIHKTIKHHMPQQGRRSSVYFLFSPTW